MDNQEVPGELNHGIETDKSIDLFLYPLFQRKERFLRFHMDTIITWKESLASTVETFFLFLCLHFCGFVGNFSFS